MRKLMSKKGFTLVELMIVVVILGILVAIAVPIFGAVTKNAKTKSCKSNQRVIKGNMETYMMTGNNGDQVANPAEGATLTLDDSIASFKNLFDGDIPKCPSDKTSEYTIYVQNDGGTISFNVLCTSADATDHNA